MAAATSSMRRRIDREGAVPFYYQLRQILLADVGLNLKPGDRMPSEGEMCSHYGVSRTVVRQAVDELGREGVIYKVKGKGTFVTSRKLESSHVQNVAGFYASMASKGHTISSRMLRQVIVPASAYVAQKLSLDIGAPVVAIDRVRSVDGEPISVVRACLPQVLVPGLESIDLREVSMYAVISERFGLRPHHGRRTIEAIAISVEDAAYLGVKPGLPALRLESVARTAENVALEHFESVYRGDRSKLDIQLADQQ